MPVSFDGQLNYRRWDDEPPAWSYLGPFASNEERLIQQALTSALMTAEEIQQNVQPPLPQVAVFRPRVGYPTVEERQARIEDIVGLERVTMHPASTWFSGGPAGYTGSPRFENNGLGFA